MPEETPASAPVSPTAPPMEPRPDGFSLPLSAWLAWGISAGLLVLHAFSYQKNPSAYQQGQMIGLVGGLWVFPTVAAWILWRIAGRAVVAGRIGFFVVLVMLVAGQIPESLRQAQRHAAVDKLRALTRESKAEMLTAMEKDGSVSRELASRTFDRANANLTERASASEGDDREIALGFQAYLARGNLAQQRQVAAAGALNTNSYFALDGLATASQRTSQHEALRQLREAHAGVREFLENGRTWLEAELTRRKVSPGRIRAVVSGYAHAANRKMATGLAIHAADEELIDVMQGFISFAEEHEGRWSRDAKTGDLVLPTDAAVEKYNTLVAQANEAIRKQRELRIKLLSDQPAAK